MGSKPILGHLRVFGCLAHMKVAGAHIKKLDDRSIQVVNLGSEPGTKVYRLFDPVGKRIHVSRDVVFEETKSWPWSNHEDFNSCSSIPFSVPEIIEMTSGENVEGDVSDGGETGEDAAVTLPRTQQSTTHEMVISPHRYDDSGEPRRSRPLSEVYAET